VLDGRDAGVRLLRGVALQAVVGRGAAAEGGIAAMAGLGVEGVDGALQARGVDPAGGGQRRQIRPRRR